MKHTPHNIFKFEDNHFEPLPKISDQDIDKVENSYKNSYLSSQIQKEIHFTHQKAQTNYKTNIDEQNLYSYMLRHCQHSACRSIENCTTCFMRNSNMWPTKIDNSIIYKNYNEQEYLPLITGEDIQKAVEKFPIPSTEKAEILSIFSLHWKISQHKALPLTIPSTTYLYPFIWLTAQKIIQKTEFIKETLAQGKDYHKARNIIYSALSIADQDIGKNLISLTASIKKRYFASLSSPKSSIFFNLKNILFYLTKGNTATLHNLFLLIGKSYIGQNGLNLLTEEHAPLLTIIHCQNPKYIADFLTDLFPNPSAVTNHPLKSLRHELIPQLICDKFNFTRINIDYSDSTSSNLAFLKKLFTNANITIDDSLFSKIYYKNTAQFTYITQKVPLAVKKIFSDINYNVISFDGDIAACRYTPLDLYESTFLAISSIYYTIDTYTNNAPPLTLTTNSAPQEILSESILIDSFLSKFCINKAATFDKEKLSSINPNDIKDAKKHTALINTLGIAPLDYSTKVDLHHAFNLWYEATYQKSSGISVDDFTNNLRQKIHSVFYKKKYAREIYSKKSREARGFYGISINVAEVASYVTKQKENSVGLTEKAIQEAFTHCLEMFINKYEPILFNMYDDNDE